MKKKPTYCAYFTYIDENNVSLARLLEPIRLLIYKKKFPPTCLLSRYHDY